MLEAAYKNVHPHPGLSMQESRTAGIALGTWPRTRSRRPPASARPAAAMAWNAAE
jgi:hypothetical protein